MRIALRGCTKFSFRNVRFNSSLVVLEGNSESGLNPAVFSALNAASKLNKPVHCFYAGPASTNNAIQQQLTKYESVVASLNVVNSDELTADNCLPETVAPILKSVIDQLSDKGITHVLMASTSSAKSLLPRLAAFFDSAPLTDVTDIVSENVFVRPIYAGNAVSKVEHTGKNIKFLTVRPTAFGSLANANLNAANKIQLNDHSKNVPVVVFTQNKFVEKSLSKSELPEMSEASVVLAGGRGFKNKEGFELIYKLAKKMNAAVGASRAAVDAGFCPNDLQIGQTGKVIAPQLYIGFGISGAIQHVAGMKDSKVIVAVNTEAENPLFDIADYKLVGDLFKVIPEMEQKIKQ